MNGRELQRTALLVAGALPAVTQTQPFGDAAEVFKVVGKVFALVSTRGGEQMVTMKAAPPHTAALVRDHPSISPGYHMNKRHWITVVAGPDVDRTLVEDLIGNSYDLVVSTLPRDRRPLDPVRRSGDGDGDGDGDEDGVRGGDGIGVGPRTKSGGEPTSERSRT